MKILKFIFKFILLPFIILNVLAVIFFTVKNKIYLAGEDQTHINYLNKNMETLDKTNATFNTFDSAFYNNSVFILSENHGFADVQNVDEQLFIHLNKKMGLRFYIAEMDSLRANRLNVFLKNPVADLALLKSVVKDIAIRIPQQSSQQLYEKWLHIHAYNQQLAANAKVEVLGLDQNFEETNVKIGRDSSMLLNFFSMVEKRGLKNEKFYGLFGYFHSMQQGVTEKIRYPFAAKLRRNATFPQLQNVQTIACLTLESEMYLPPTEGMPTPPDQKLAYLNADGPVVLVKGINDLKAVTQPNSMTIFHLNNANSPFKNSQRLAGVKVNLLGDEVLPNNEKQVTTDFFQHVILLRGSKSLLPLK